MRDQITTEEFAQILGKSCSTIYKFLREKELFPKPIKLREGTRFVFSLQEIIDWMAKNDLESKVDLSELLKPEEAPAKEMLTTTEVLILMKLKPTPGNRSDLARFIKAKVFPPPSVQSEGRNENLWESDTIRPVVLAWRKNVDQRQGCTRRHWSDLPGLPTSPEDPDKRAIVCRREH